MPAYRMNEPLTTIDILRSACVRAPSQAIVSQLPDGYVHQYTYVHALNARLFAEQLAYIINHAEDRWLFVDPEFLPLESIQQQIPPIEKVIVLCDEYGLPALYKLVFTSYETLIDSHSDDFSWPHLSSDSPCGEWISAVELENAALHYSAVNEACVIGALHEQWDERPIMVITLRPGEYDDEARLKTVLAERVVKWWLPDAIIVVDELPHTGTGKLRTLDVRDQYRHYLLNSN